MDKQTESALMTPNEVWRDYFKGKLGRNAVYEALRRGDIPSTRIGDRIFISRKRLVETLEGGESAGLVG